MKKASFILVAAVLAALTGCVVTSVYPFYTEKDVVFEPTLLGEWIQAKTDKPNEYVKIERASGKAYRATVFTAQETGRVDVVLFRLKDQLFFDSCQTNRSLDYVPVHQLARVTRLQPTLETVDLNYDWLKKLLAQNPGELRHLALRDNPEDDDPRIILTADTSELQRFILKHVNDTNAWKEPEQWKQRD